MNKNHTFCKWFIAQRTKIGLKNFIDLIILKRQFYKYKTLIFVSIVKEWNFLEKRLEKIQ